MHTLRPLKLGVAQTRTNSLKEAYPYKKSSRNKLKINYIQPCPDNEQII